MAKRKCYKRPRRKQLAHQSQEVLSQESESSDAAESVEIKSTPFKVKIGSAKRLLRHRSPESVLCESQPSDLSFFDDLSPEIVPNHRRNKLDLNAPDEDGIEIKSNIERRSGLTEIKQVDLSKQNINILREACFPLDKTMSINDEIKLDMRDYVSLHKDEDTNFTKTTLDVYARDDDIPAAKSARDSSRGHTSEPIRFPNLNSRIETDSHALHNFLDDFRCDSAAESARRDDKDENYHEEWNGEKPDRVSFEIVNEKNFQHKDGKQCAENWTNCKRILSSLHHLYSFQTRTKYKRLDEPKSSRTSSSCSSQTSLNSADNSGKRISKRSLEESEKTDVDEQRDYGEIKNTVAKIRERSTTPCSGSPPPAKRCRTTLKFDDQEEAERNRRSTATAQVVDLLPVGKKNDENGSCPSTTIAKAVWSSGRSESPTTFILDLPVVSDSGGYSRCLQEVIRLTY